MGKPIELLGATPQAISVVGRAAHAAVQLDQGVRSEVVASLTNASEAQHPDRVYLDLENVSGASEGHILSVYINVPAGETPAQHPELHAGDIGLFGLSQASQPTEAHAGQGLNFTLDITNIVDTLFLRKQLDTNTLNVTIVPKKDVSAQAQLTVGRISVHRQGA